MRIAPEDDWQALVALQRTSDALEADGRRGFPIARRGAVSGELGLVGLRLG